MSKGTSRTSPQIVSSPNTNRVIYTIQIIYVDSDSLVLEIAVTENCLAILQNVTVYNEQNSLLPANINIVNNGNFTYSITIDFLFPIVEHIINFMIEWDLSAYNGGFPVIFDFENTAIPFRKQLKTIIKKVIKKIEIDQKKVEVERNPFVTNKGKITAFSQKNILPKSVTNYANIDVFTYKLRNRKRFKKWQLDNAALNPRKIDFGILELNPLIITAEV